VSPQYGRLVDLCSPIHRKYQLAVTKVFGRYLNAVVVSTEKVACSGIQYLRQERAEAETFLPINYLIVSRGWTTRGPHQPARSLETHSLGGKSSKNTFRRFLLSFVVF